MWNLIKQLSWYFTTTLNHKRVNYVKFIIRVSTAVYDVECSPPSIDQMSGGAGLASDVYVVVNGVLIAIWDENFLEITVGNFVAARRNFERHDVDCHGMQECICLSRELTVSSPRKVSISFNWIKLRLKDSKIVCVAFKLLLKFRTLFIRRLAAVEISLGFMEKHFPGKSIFGKLFANCSALQCWW